MSFLTAASERSSSGLSGVSAPSGFSPLAGVLSSLPGLAWALVVDLGGAWGAALGSISVSVFTGFKSVFAGVAFAGVFGSVLDSVLVGSGLVAIGLAGALGSALLF